MIAVLCCSGFLSAENMDMEAALAHINSNGTVAAVHGPQAQKRSSARHKTYALPTIQRTQLTPEVAAYRIQLQIGPSDHDVIGLHRVVREQDGLPVAADRAMFLVHGDLFDFEGIFLAGQSNGALPPEHSYALFLAEAGVDVWGIDRRWTQIPAESTEFAFLEDWDMAREVEDVSIAMWTARLLRFYTTGQVDRFTLQGWSSGGSIAWAVANHETRLPQTLRQVGSLIPTDTFFKLPEGVDVSGGLRACARLEKMQAELAAGETYWKNTDFLAFTQLFQADPDGASPIFPGYTNRQALLAVGGLTFLLDGDIPFTPGYHFVGAHLDAQSIPQGLAYSSLDAFAGLVSSLRPFQDKGTRLDMEIIVCGETPSIHSDRLDQLAIPVMYVGAAGGFGRLGAHTLQLLENSPEVSELIIQNFPEEAAVLDYGHADLFLATDAPDQVWGPILEWVLAH